MACSTNTCCIFLHTVQFALAGLGGVGRGVGGGKLLKNMEYLIKYPIPQ